MFMNVPGLRVIAPASPTDAKGLLRTAVESEDPVMIFEACLLWGMKEDVPDEEYRIPFGVGRTVREGSDLTVVAISNAVVEATAAADALAAEGISVEVFDPRTLVPLDVEGILASVRKTGRLVVADRRIAPAAQPARSQRSSRVTAPADPPGHDAGHADSLQPLAGEADVPQPHHHRGRRPQRPRRRGDGPGRRALHGGRGLDGPALTEAHRTNPPRTRTRGRHGARRGPVAPVGHGHK
jgi:hypothetical protein